MAEEPNPSSQKIIKVEGTAKDQSKLTQIGSIKAENFYLTAEQLQILVQLESINKPESPGVLKAGNPNKSLAYWQGRKIEIAQIQQWLTDKNTFLIGIEGIGGTGKSMLAAKIYDEIEGFPKGFRGFCRIGRWASPVVEIGRRFIKRRISPRPGFKTIGRFRLREFAAVVDRSPSGRYPSSGKCGDGVGVGCQF
ncbi:MAG: hypothetical protein V7K27_28640 [Nostoc sp.]|uniref:hypothetical protein n=1 Tax=Nostoc sp. TaxID=1180 RepID=UPI002FFA3249